MDTDLFVAKSLEDFWGEIYGEKGGGFDFKQNKKIETHP